MYELKPKRHYEIIEVFPESNYICHKERLEGSICILTPENRQLELPRAPKPDTSRHVHHARVKILTGKLFSRVILLTHFAAHIKDNREQCECDAYPFPHRMGGGKCEHYPNDEYGYSAWCGSCGKSCIPQYVDEGIGETEAWGIVQFHHDWVYRSDCCREPIFGNAECTRAFEPSILEDYDDYENA